MATQTGSASDAEFKAWDHIVLPARVKDSLLSVWRMIGNAAFLKLQSVTPTNILIVGAPGTGKTEISKAFAMLEGVRFLDTKPAEFRNRYIGQGRAYVQEVFLQARADAPAIVRIEDIEYLFSVRAASQDFISVENTAAFLTQLDNVGSSPVYVLGETYYADRVDAAVSARFAIQIEIPMPDEAARREIVERNIRKLPVDSTLDVEEVSRVIAHQMNGKSGRDLVMLVRRALERNVDVDDPVTEFRLTRESLLAGLPQQEIAVPGAVTTNQPAKETPPLLDLTGTLPVLPKETRRELATLAEVLRRWEEYQAKGIQMPSGVLLFGAPGTDIAHIVRRIAREAGVPLIAASPSEIKSGFFGRSALNIRQLFERARNTGPCVLFLNELEKIAAQRGTPLSDSQTNEIVTELLMEIDGLNRNGNAILFLAATNQRQFVDVTIQSHVQMHIEIRKPEI